MKNAHRRQAVEIVAGTLLWWALAVPEAKAVDANLSRTFKVAPGGTLVVDADRGALIITTGDREDVLVEVERATPGLSDAAAQSVLQDHQVQLEQSGDRVEVRASFSTQQWFARDRNKLRVHYRIAVPKRFNLDLGTSAGDIACGDIEGAVKAKTAGGSLKFQEVTGSLDAQTSAGSIEARRVSGQVKAKTAGGSIAIGETGADAAVETSAGGISIEKCLAALKAKTSGGNITLGDLDGRATVSTSAGSIKIRSVRAPLEAVTSGGGIEITQAAEAVQAHTSAGSIKAEFTAEPESDSRLSTSGGGIQVRLPKNAGFDIDAKTSGGRVTCRLPMKITTSTRMKNQLEGQINEGGRALVLRTSAGNITIE